MKSKQITFAPPKPDPVVHSQIRDTIAGAIEQIMLAQYPANVRRVTDSHFILTVPVKGVEYRVRIEVKKC